MEGVTAAEAAIGIVGALKATADATKLFYLRAKTAGETLQDIHISFQTCHTTLDLWIRFWGLHKGVSRRYQQTLWGEEGMQTINLQLAKVQSHMEDVNQELSPLLTRGGMGEKNKRGLNWISAADLRQSAAKAQKALKMRDLFWFARGKGDDLSTLVTRLAASISELRELSVTCFSLIHGPALLQHPPERLANDMRFETFIRAVLDARTGARMYFEELFRLVRETLPKALGSRYPKTAQLDLQVVKPQFQTVDKAQRSEHIQLRYHVCLNPSSELPRWEPLHMLSDGPHRFRSNFATSPIRTSFSAEPGTTPGIWDAYDAARQSTTSQFVIRDSRRNDTVAWFRARPPQSWERIFPPLTPDLRIQEQLAELLHPLPTRHNTGKWSLIHLQDMGFTLSQRISLAHRVIQSSLYLAGTPWLSGFGYGKRCLMRSSPAWKDSDGKIHPLADPELSGEAHPFIIEIDTDTNIQESTSFDALVQHLRFLGIIMLELGMGKLVQEIKRDSAGVACEFAFKDTPASTGNCSASIEMREKDGKVAKVQGKSVEKLSWLHFAIYVILVVISWAGFGNQKAAAVPTLDEDDTSTANTMPASEVYLHLTVLMGDSFATVVRTLINTPGHVGGFLASNTTPYYDGGMSYEASNTLDVLRWYWTEIQSRLDELHDIMASSRVATPESSSIASFG
ncbi:hypothetical protein QBC43DRAFT_112010 [Cladorrhinum sp. PSN259]|nr:hypothetical protein QBC43DRAFT_112010 [Cladorrhinum sp. PSN259]